MICALQLPRENIHIVALLLISTGEEKNDQRVEKK